MRGEVAGGPLRPVLVAGDDVGVLQMRQQDFGLGGLAGFPRLDLDDLDGPKPQRPSGGGGALGVVAAERRLRRPAELADAQ